MMKWRTTALRRIFNVEDWYDVRLLPTAAERVKRTTRAGLFEKSRAPTKFQTQHNFISSPSQQRLVDNICKYCQPQRHIAAGDVRSLKNTTVEWTRPRFNNFNNNMLAVLKS